MKRSRIVVCAVLVAAGFFISGFFHSGRVGMASTASGALLPEAHHIGAWAGDVTESAKERQGGTDGTAQVSAEFEPHESGPIDPWMPRPIIPPPGAMEHSGPWTRGVLQSIQVNVDVDGNNIVGDAANEPSIAIDPTNPNNIVIGWRQFDSVGSNFRQAGYAYSRDAGQTWTFPGVLDPGQFRTDPVLGADREGNIYYYNIRCTSNGCGDVFRSEDAGRTWAGPFFAVGGDREWMTVDATDGPGSGHVYASWRSSFVRSVDGGLSFEGPFPVSASRGHTTVGLDSVVYVVQQAESSGSTVSRSLNARDPDESPSFQQVAQVDMGGVNIGGRGPNPGGGLAYPWIAVDHSKGDRQGNLYILQAVDPPGGDPLDVMFVHSADGGSTWSDPIRVNDDDPDTNAWQWFAIMSVAPNGRIDAVWNDTRNTGVTRRSETFYAYSNDGGMTWTRNLPISPAWDSWIGWPNQNKIGDYYHMISDDSAANLAYAATFNGEQDVYFLRIIPDCNENGVPDDEDIRDGTSEDCDENGIPDECDRDCNENGEADACDIRDGTSEDCNENGIPDECEVLTLDGYALSFERNSARVIVSDFDGFPTEEITVSQWLRTSDPSRQAGIFSYAVPEEDDEFLILGARNLVLFINGTPVLTGVAVTDGDWHHVAVTWASADGFFRLYLDGILRFAGVVAPGHLLRPEGTVVLADDQDSVGGGFDGRQALRGAIDELRVWNIVRSGEEIRADMRRRLSGDEPGLVSYWRFDEGEGATTEDLAGDNDGEVLRAVWIETFGCECVRDPEWMCDGDVDGDEQVNPVDSGLVQAAFGSGDEQDLCNYDIDCDGQINPVDSGIVQSLFGTCDPPRDVCP